MKTFKFTCGFTDYPVTVTYYQPAAIAEFEPQRRPLVILLPGGGYAFYSDRENEIVALQYLAQGFAVAVVAYRLIEQPPVLPGALYQLAGVVHEFHQHAGRYGISATHILLVGFSAGGHLAALYAGLWPRLAADLQVSAATLRVSALTLGYPMIGLRLGWPTDAAVASAIVGTWPQHEADQVVTAQNPPTFIWTTAEDELVPAENARRFITALHQHGVPMVATIYPHGPHGLSLARAVTAFPMSFKSAHPDFGERFIRPDVAEWFDQQLQWLAELWDLNAFWRRQ
ncbi:alpha/beta hydrolase [Levilactobacillus tujiorum]|uniref:alpha/beta hydrolase n=1 Tax=Levilactobacillus tujiorum TaxID=2912243 RepID=UPI0014569D4C|nr:alpha/beta hydrolase [Levilactobacillus tujiorum]NLR32077.1 alpha/beta hydrolase [Levilactobacillus tujiorum]